MTFRKNPFSPESFIILGLVLLVIIGLTAWGNGGRLWW
jgi:hypothetical protein